MPGAEPGPETSAPPTAASADGGTPEAADADAAEPATAKAPPEGSPSGDGLPEGATAGQAVTAAEAIALADPQRVRRAPRYGRFAMTGVVLGIVVCSIVVLIFAEPNEYRSLPGVFLLISAVTLPIFALLGCLLAVLLDRRRSGSGRRGRPKN